MGSDRADNFLRLIRRSQRGRLKIYLGYAAGVGKTYQMLLEGHRIMQDEIDVAIGVVETHGRAETEALVAGLPVIPRRKITYRGIVLDEMDLDSILALHPHVVLVDELAHTNVPGSKNAKRYQDVEELLAAGIHVVSTLNIQHLESLYETVERVTAVKVRERIPDRIIAEADQLVNVDVTIEDLRRRLKDGKVYTPERVETALNHFFRPPNLEQLRELTLRELAAQIDSRQRGTLNDDVSSSPDQVMVCLSSKGPNSEALLRYASRLAGRLNRNWYAVYVQTARERPTVIDAATQRRLSNTLGLAQQLGATVFTYKGDDVVKTILQFAKEYRVGTIVIGGPGKKMPVWKRLRGETGIVDRLITEGNGITVVVLDTRHIPEDRSTMVPSRSGNEARPEPPQPSRIHAPESMALLSQTTALVWEEPIEKEAAIRLLLDSLPLGGSELKARALDTVLKREQQGGTLVGEDVAIPHARIDGLSQPLIAIGIGKKGIQDRDAGRNPKIVVLLLSTLAQPDRHIAALGIISRMAADDLLRNRLLASSESQSARELIQSWSNNMVHHG